MKRVWAGLLCALLSGTAGAQPVADAPLLSRQQSAPAILTVDIERLFSQSQFGDRLSRDYAEGRADLAAENRRIADALREEELALAAQRPEMDPAVFRVEAEAFDAKAQGIRRAQDAKERALEDTLSSARSQFLEATSPILGQLMVDRGAYAILDRRSVLLSLGAIDVTDEAVLRIDSAIGDGSDQDAGSVTPEQSPEVGGEQGGDQ